MRESILNFKSPFRIVLAISMVLTGLMGYAQDITKTQWYFGNSSANFVFDKNGVLTFLEDNQFTPFGEGGSTVISDDLTGNLLFYSDGSQVIDATHRVVPNGSGLIGDPSINVPAVSCPVPNSTDRYYLFANPGTTGNAIQYYELDAGAEGRSTTPEISLGVVTGGGPIALPLEQPSEAMIIIPSENNETFWLISQNRNTFRFKVTQITELGIGNTDSVDLTTPEYPGAEISHFAFNEDSSLLAAAPKSTFTNVAIFNFDRETGTLSFNQQLLNTGFNDELGESVYDVEWSGDGTKLYFSRFGGLNDTGTLYYHDLNDTLGNVTAIVTDLRRSLGLQRGLDGNIYHIYQEGLLEPYLIGRVTNADSTIDLVRYEAELFEESDFNGRQFPQFSPTGFTGFNSINFTWRDSCEGDFIKFFPDVDPLPHNYAWIFGDGFISREIAPVYQYGAAGFYQVVLGVERNGVVAFSDSIPVSVIANNLQVSILCPSGSECPEDTTICEDAPLRLEAGITPATGNYEITWSSGQTGQVTNRLDTTGTHWLQVTNLNTGCSSLDVIEVTEYGVEQSLANQWYFGEMAGLDFNQDPPAALVDTNMMFSPEGAATISDSDGNLLFYTNGSTVWNKDHEVMANGMNIGGDSTASQSAVIFPFPTDETIFYIFTTEEVFGDGSYQLKYAVVDIKEDTALGEVIIKDQVLFDNNTEKVTVTGFGGSTFLLTHEYGNNSFKSNFVYDQGIATSVYSPVGEVIGIEESEEAAGYLKFAPGLGSVANVVPGANILEIFDFDVGIGRLSNPRSIDTQEPASNPLYGLEYSGDGQKLYVTTTGTGSKLIQYDLDSIGAEDSETIIASSKYDAYPTGTNYGALQRGPNGTIYLAVDGAGNVMSIDVPAGDDDAATFNQDGVDLGGRTSRLGLPNFAQSVGSSGQEPGIVAGDVCYATPAIFSAQSTSNIDQYEWRFGQNADPTTSTEENVEVTFFEAGLINVELRIYNDCGFDSTFVQEVDVTLIPEVPQVPDNPVICEDRLELTAWPEDRDDLSYLWYTLDDFGNRVTYATTRTATVFDPIELFVEISNQLGCPSESVPVFVGEGRPSIDLGADRTLCQNEIVPDLDAQNANVSYSWQIDGIVIDTSRFLTVDTSIPGTYEYIVSVEVLNGCVNSDTLNITVVEEPDVIVDPATTSGCGASDAQISFVVNEPGNFTYELQGDAAYPQTSVTGQNTETIPALLGAGSYSLIIRNSLSGCTDTLSIPINDTGAFGLTSVPQPACGSDGDLLLVTTDVGSGVPTNANIRITNEQGQEVFNEINRDVSLPIENLDTGLYYVLVEDFAAPNCTQADTVLLEESDPGPDFSYSPIQEVCGVPGDIFITDESGGIAIYSWTGPGIAPQIGTSISVFQSGTYQVVASGIGFCPRTVDIDVTVFDVPTVIIDSAGDPCDGEIILTANLANASGGPYTYQWNNPDSTETRELTVTESGSYEVTVLDTQTGCVVSEGIDDIIVEEELEVLIISEPDCDENGTIYLTATHPNINESLPDDVTFTWLSDDDGTLPASGDNLTVTESGIYIAQITNSNGTCTTADSIEVSVVLIDRDSILVADEVGFCRFDEISEATLDAGFYSNFSTYEWREFRQEDTLSTNSVIMVSEAGRYEVTVNNGFTCVRKVVRVFENCLPKITAPNAFSPNGNGQNEEWFVVPNPDVDNFQIFIYTRWGELVYKSSDINFRWDGIFENRILPVGTYAYVIKFTSSLTPEQGVISQYGSIMLIK